MSHSICVLIADDHYPGKQPGIWIGEKGMDGFECPHAQGVDGPLEPTALTTFEQLAAIFLGTRLARQAGVHPQLL